MGVASLNGNQFFDRMMLWVTDPKLYPASHYVNKVPHRVIHYFTILQFACFLILWILKASPLGILFPLMIAALVPIRYFASKFFQPEDIKILLEDDEKEDEEMWGGLG